MLTPTDIKLKCLELATHSDIPGDVVKRARSYYEFISGLDASETRQRGRDCEPLASTARKSVKATRG
jgi:hypothetical protein